MGQKGEPKIAIVHDEFVRRGGAEKVVEEMVRIFPTADVYGLYAGQPEMIVDGVRYTIRTSFLQKLPVWFRRHPSHLLPLLSAAAEQFDLSGYDLVISSASGFAKAVVTRINVPHICYCHAPTRYLWDSTHEALAAAKPLLRWPARLCLHYLRMVDFAASQRVDQFIGNSHYTQRRIARYYRRSSEVIYPPIDTAWFTPRYQERAAGIGPKKFFVCVGRLSRAKLFNRVMAVCSKLKLGLVVVGTGREFKTLARRQTDTITLVGRANDEELREYLRSATALIQPGVEDFGMAAAEALACGTPVIGLNKGGVKEVVVHGVTGLLYDSDNEEALAECLRVFLSNQYRWSREAMQQSVLKFAKANFHERMRRVVSYALAKQANLE